MARRTQAQRKDSARELREARAQQAATAAILKVIARSRGDAQPVFEAIQKSCEKLFRGFQIGISVVGEDGQLHLGAYRGPGREKFASYFPMPLSRATGAGSAILGKRVVEYADMLAKGVPEYVRKSSRATGTRSIIFAPMLRQGRGIGAIYVARNFKGSFSAKERSLLKTFADQAVIAIENVRLFNETKEALERQTATSEVLKTISRSTFDLNAVLQVLIENATRLAGAHQGFIFRFDGKLARLAYSYNAPPAYREHIEAQGGFGPGRGGLVSRVLLERRTVHIVDATADPEFTLHEAQRLGGFRSMLGVPMMREGNLIGVIAMWTTEVRPFSEKQIELVSTFADQAVIAIENVRLFNETKQALERQTATAEILRVISGSPDDVQPVLEAVVDSAARLCDAKDVLLLLKEGDELRYRAHRGEIAPAVPMGAARRISRDWSAGRCAADARQLHIHDITAEPDEYPDGAQMGARAGYRTVLGTPLLREGIVLGVILMRRAEVRPFETRQIELINTFADQAVIAIENVRLFNETKEALERQTATADILRVIGSSPTDVQPVFEAIVQSGLALFPEATVGVALPDGKQMRMAALANRDPAIAAATRARFPIELSREYLHGAALLDARVVDIPDATLVQQGDFPAGVANFLASGNRAITVMPMVRGDRAIGTISVTRRSPGPLSEKQMALLRTFADQAVIAIENVRLFNETKEALERQTATAEILKVIAGSPADVQPVFDSIVESAARLFGRRAILRTVEGSVLRLRAYRAARGSKFVPADAIPIDRDSLVGTVALDARACQFSDAQAPDAPPYARTRAHEWDYRANAAVPLMRGATVIGVISMISSEVGVLSDKQLALVAAFADQAVIAIENVRLFNETKESLERQTATAEILRVIASSPSDVQPVFDAIAGSAKRLLAGHAAVVARRNGDMLELAAYTSTGEAGDAALKKLLPVKITGQGHSGKAILTGAPVLVADVETDPDYSEGFRVNARARGFRSVVSVPMLREGEPIGVISVYRPVPGKFSEHQTSLLKTFADQAVIAIENVRLFNETKEALERQTATADVLAAISGAQTNVDPVFRAIARNAQRLCNAVVCNVLRYDGELLHVAASHGFSPADEQKLREKYPVKAGDASVLSGRVIATRQIEHIYDAQAEPGYDHAHARQGAGWRRMLGVPLLRDDVPLGVIVVAWSEPGRIPDAEIDLLKTFAAQASIAIENVRLFNETKESLAQQTATADILRVIGGSITETKPVFEAIVKSCHSLFGVGQVSLRLVQDGRLKRQASVGETSEEVPIDRDSAAGTCVLERKLIHLPDLEKALDRFPGIRNLGLKRGYHSGIYTPLLRAGEAIGTISVLRVQAGAFSDKEASLLQTFADQAVIAIENVRLFNETKEALERQTATAEILRVIARSPTDVQPVFDVIVESAVKLCGARFGRVYRYDGSVIYMVASHGLSSTGLGTVQGVFPRPATQDTIAGQVILSKQPYFVKDIEEDASVPPLSRQMIESLQTRSQVTIPMMGAGEPIGAFTMGWAQPNGFDDQQVALLQTFADQAVIAIENVRLFNETKEALERQTATAEILRVISSSPTDVRPVFDAIVNSGVRLFAGAGVFIGIVHGQDLVCEAAAGAGVSPVGLSVPVTRESAGGTAILERRVVNVRDTEAPDAPLHARENARRIDIRSMIHCPMFREGEAIGTVGVIKREPGGLDDKQLALLKTFADQAVIAIENVRLFKELQQREEALTKSVGQLTALGEVGQALSSTLELDKVLKTIVERAVKLTGLDGGSIYEYDEAAQQFSLQAAENMKEELVRAVRETPVKKGEGAIGRSAETLEPVQIADIADESYGGRRKELLIRAGYRAILAVPLLREGQLLGALQVFRGTPGEFAPEVVELLKTFATQSAMAIQNARLFREIAEKGRELEVASRHKSQFLASMSHELRTPLNAILGFNEMILGEVYGPVPAEMKEPLTDIQTSGKHLLRLINNVLDLAKIEAGRMELALGDYSVQDTVESVRSTLRPLAAEKGLEFLASVPVDLPLAYGDAGRITQCLMNLAGNSLKFTKQGKVEIAVTQANGTLTFRVSDTGVGIPADKIGSLFTEFKQTDATIASEYGGTGLGLSISKKFVEMHGGRIWVESEPGRGSSFIFELPLRVKA